jgi:integrase
MGDKRPRPVLRGGSWEVDLRPWGFGWHYKLGGSAMTEVEAVHAAYERLAALHADRQAAAPQPRPVTFGAALEAWEARKEYDTTDGELYGERVAALVRRDLGDRELQVFAGAGGEDELLAYKRVLEARGLGARTIRNRFSVLGQVLKFAATRHMLPGVPSMPKMPRKPKPKFDWIDEATFRAIRSEIFASGRVTADETNGELVPIYIVRRRVYLSWLFYAGPHDIDARRLDDSFIALDVGTYRRHNNKSADHVPDEEFEMPEPLIDDFRELLRVLGRPAFYCGEAIAGGAWTHVNRVVQTAQRRLRIPGAPINTRIFRRSYAREMFIRGYTLQEVSDRMGHVNQQMLREVYMRTPRPAGAAKSRWKRTPMPGSPLTHAGARVIPFVTSRAPAEASDATGEEGEET